MKDQETREWDKRIHDKVERVEAGLSRGDVLWKKWKQKKEKECTQKQQS